MVSVGTDVVSGLASLLSLPPQPAAMSATAAMRSAASRRPFTSSPFVSWCAGHLAPLPGIMLFGRTLCTREH
jgi:hypothetical protein